MVVCLKRLLSKCIIKECADAERPVCGMRALSQRQSGLDTERHWMSVNAPRKEREIAEWARAREERETGNQKAQHLFQCKGSRNHGTAVPFAVSGHWSRWWAPWPPSRTDAKDADRFTSVCKISFGYRDYLKIHVKRMLVDTSRIKTSRRREWISHMLGWERQAVVC